MLARGPRCAELHPVGKRGDLLFFEFSLRRHLQFVAVVDGGNEAALFRLTGDDRGTSVAAGHHGIARVEAKACLLFFRTVALVAMRGQDRPNRLFEEVDAFAVGRGFSRLYCSRKEGEQAGGETRELPARNHGLGSGVVVKRRRTLAGRSFGPMRRTTSGPTPQGRLTALLYRQSKGGNSSSFTKN